MGITCFTQLDVWKVAHRITLAVYQLTHGFPSHERFGLTGQMRRAASSIPINITEGFGLLGRRDKIRFYNIAQSSAEELKYELILSKDLRYCPEQTSLRADLDIVCRGLCRLIQSIASSLPPSGGKGG